MKTIFNVCIVMFVIGMVFWGLNTIDFNKKDQTTLVIPQVLKTELPVQMVIDVVMPAYVKAEQIDVDLCQKDPEAYMNRFNSNDELYNRSVKFVYENGVNVGDTVQLSYCSYFNYQDVSDWNLVSTRPPFCESIKQTESEYVEYIKGVVAIIK